MRLFNHHSKTPKSTVEKAPEDEVASGRIETVGGHNGNFTAHDGFLTKTTNQTEARFYARMMEKPCGLSEFMPSCTSIYFKEGTSKKVPAEVTLEDLRKDFSLPLIYDIKLGTKTISSREVKASGLGHKHSIKKDVFLHIADNKSSSKERGYRFTGCSHLGESRKHLATHPDEMIKDLCHRLSARDLTFVIAELERLDEYFHSKEGRQFEMVGASVLIVTESDPKQADPPLPKVKLIDFAHSNYVDRSGFLLSNGVLHTRNRKKIYQSGIQHGLISLTEDLQRIADEEAAL